MTYFVQLSIIGIFAGMMALNEKKQKLEALFSGWSGEAVVDITAFPPSGSNRKYFRILGAEAKAIGVIGEDPRENRAFLTFSRQFRKLGLAVPEIFGEDQKEGIYLQEDLGDTSLFELVTRENTGQVSEKIRQYYKSSLEELIRFQVDGAHVVDFTLCFPVSEFSGQSMMWDLNYFKYYFLRPSGISYDEQQLENDFIRLVSFLEQADNNYFIYRDFQSRNIFIRDDKPWFIDYQGGRKGPGQYDLASLLFQARAGLPHAFRKEMLDFYMDKLAERKEFDRAAFEQQYYGFVLHRSLQVLGAYGYRGFFEQKPHFIESAGFALDNVRWLLGNVTLPFQMPELYLNLEQLVRGRSGQDKPKGLTVDISSFSYLKYGYPKDSSGHGGGFVFDCRALPNPGRYEEFKTITGMEKPVIEFLEKEQAVADFLHHVFRIVGQAVDNYLARNFDHLSVNFGCTGGQHRSVYCAERLYAYLRENYRINVNISHKMLE